MSDKQVCNRFFMICAECDVLFVMKTTITEQQLQMKNIFESDINNIYCDVIHFEDPARYSNKRSFATVSIKN